METRNIAIIAHVDHGKTTLVDELLKQSGTFRENEYIQERAMDNNDIERERGITILAKTTAINYNNYRINIVDTPGHADFGGEVERIMHMVDGALLIVDAYEGTMPQTRFVLKKALEAKIKIIVVINKVDRKTTRVNEVVDEVLELFMELGATDEQLDFPIVFASALEGTSSLNSNKETQEKTMKFIFNTIIDYIPSSSKDTLSPLQLQVALMDYNDYVGRIGIGKINKGKIKIGENVSCCRLDGSIKQFKVQKLYGFLGLKKQEINEAFAGDIVAIAGLPDISVGETICNVGKENPIEILKVSEPTLQMTFSVNKSPLAGKEGKFVTVRKLEERLQKELQKDVSLKVEQKDTESFIVSGRGELHLSILIENMRREGYEIEVSKPEVIYKEINGKKYEPYEELQIEVKDENMGSIIENLGKRAGNLKSIKNNEAIVRLVYEIPSRGLIGFTTDFMTLTKGYGIINHTFSEYKEYVNQNFGERKLGVLVSMENGKASSYGLYQLEDRSTMFIEPGTEVYEGMIVGEHIRENDLAVNVVKNKQQTNTRSATKDATIVLKKPRQLTLEKALDFINSDELVEVTPPNFRLRKKILNTEQRKKNDKNKDKD